MTVEWSDPPLPRRGPNNGKRWPAIADALRERPGEWALVAENVDPSTVSNITRGRYAGMPAGSFEATGRRVGDGSSRVNVWARFVAQRDPCNGADVT